MVVVVIVCWVEFGLCGWSRVDRRGRVFRCRVKVGVRFSIDPGMGLVC